jgi:subtilisin family serine protease
VLDSGVDIAHPDLAPRLAAQHCFNKSAQCPPGNTVEGESAPDKYGHGTHVAGIIAGQGQFAPAGLAPGAGLVAVRVLDNNGAGYSSDVIAGMEWVAANQAALKVRVLNLSLGGGSYAGQCDQADANTMLYAAATARLRQAGITIFAASGNRGLTDAMMAPACVSGVVAVGNVYSTGVGASVWPTCTDAATTADQVVCASNSSAALDLLAPGVAVESTWLGGGSQVQSGTSMSTAHAAAVAVLLLEANPALTPAEVETALVETGRPITDARTGRITPRVDSVAALQRVTGDGPGFISGVIRLQGRANYSGTAIYALADCSGGVAGLVPGAVTAADGAFSVVAPAGQTVQCVRAVRAGYLVGQKLQPQGDIGQTTLPAGDATGDNVVDIFDLALIARYFNGTNPQADINGDGVVNIVDLALAAGNYRQAGPVW